MKAGDKKKNITGSENKVAHDKLNDDLDNYWKARDEKPAKKLAEEPKAA